ncbi:TIGR02452 family protein [Lachnospiraceae bacterium OF11-28]|nr:TIGR02452 family protein [Lachnospiraceae bacterium OF11-28]
MSSFENVEIFEDTKRLCETNGKIKDALARSVKNQKLILEGTELSAVDKARFEDEAKIIVSTKRTFEAAAGYAGQKVAVHNFASATNPGGGVTRGSSAQEECLCRCSGLYFCLSVPEMMKSFYYPHRNAKNPINNADIIYTPDATVFKTDTSRPKLMDEKDWYDVDVITCAAPNLRKRPSNQFNQDNGDRSVKVSDKELLEIHKKRLTRILDVAALNGAEVVILGAFGCGAFQNKPEVVARAAKEVIADYLHTFKTIEFAVYCSPR